MFFKFYIHKSPGIGSPRENYQTFILAGILEMILLPSLKKKIFSFLATYVEKLTF